VCWVLDGVLRCACVREHVRVCAMSMCLCACAHLFICVHLFACALDACARVHACMRACVSACACSCVSIGLHLRARVCSDVCVCVCSERVCALRRCARPPIARRRRTVSITRPAPHLAAARAWLRSAPPAGLARVGRRCQVEMTYGQGGMGRPMGAHVCRRCRRRHLRHRRLGPHRRHLLPGRVGEHRRRCAAGLGQRGVVRGVL
jgi:hypothetical protein